MPLGEAAVEIEGLLRPVAVDGVLTEVVTTSALIGRRPAAAAGV